MTRANFLVIGTAKSGTTSVCHYLRQHPDVFVARRKESHFFSHEEMRRRLNGPGDASGLGALIVDNLDQYARCFADSNGQGAIGEASVYYANEPKALARALEYNPDMRFLLMLRHPSLRAHSAFSHMRRDRREPLPYFLRALDEEPARVAAGWSHSYHYAGVSDYPRLIATLREVVPDDRLHISVFEELVSDPDRAMSDIFSFLGVESSAAVDTSAILNKSGRPRMQRLNDFFVGDSRTKQALKRVLPYQIGNRVAHRIRNWNLAPEEALPVVEERDRFGDVVTATEVSLGRELPVWRSSDVHAG